MKQCIIMILLAIFIMGSISACNGKSDREKSDREDTYSNTSAAEEVGESEASEDTRAEASYLQITQDKAKKMMDEKENYVILDVRTEEEYTEGHISNAICIPNETIDQNITEQLPDQEQVILVYCRSGNRSKQASEKLANLGYSNIYEFGGINTWPYEVVQ